MDDDIARRRQEVHDAQRSLNMTPRADSRLTELYAQNHLPAYMTADVVARELLATDFIYAETLYGEVIESYMRSVAHMVRESYGISWSATWNLVRFYAPIALKLMCVSASGIRIPEKYQACTND
jgi:hypothetical protein